jgi:signal transduction histidine kinase
MRPPPRFAAPALCTRAVLSRVVAMDSTRTPTPEHPLAQGNRLQRAYYRWAQPHYERIGQKDPALREQVEEVDRLLYTRSGAAVWLGWLCAIAGGAWALQRAGMPWALALGLSLLGGISVAVVFISAWLSPLHGMDKRKQRRTLVAMVLGVPAGGVCGFAVGQYLRRGSIDWISFSERLQSSLGTLVPALLGTALALLLLAWLVSQAGRAAQGRRLVQAELLAERDAARASAAEADLRLLQAQIHPHFVFNTLATLQHWVDKKDERAGPLLRELTGFLRRSTEMLGRPTIPLAEEAQAVAHYLAILQARLGQRLSYAVEIDPLLAQQALPPGLLLTLVENAIEHGLEPKIGGGRLELQTGSESDGSWWLRVDDDGQGLADGAQPNVGLANLRQRLLHRFGDRAHFSLTPRPGGGARAEIRFTRKDIA